MNYNWYYIIYIHTTASRLPHARLNTGNNIVHFNLSILILLYFIVFPQCLIQTVVLVLQYHTVQNTSGYVHEQEVVLQPVVLYQTPLTICSTDFYILHWIIWPPCKLDLAHLPLWSHLKFLWTTLCVVIFLDFALQHFSGDRELDGFFTAVLWTPVFTYVHVQ